MIFVMAKNNQEFMVARDMYREKLIGATYLHEPQQLMGQSPATTVIYKYGRHHEHPRYHELEDMIKTRRIININYL